MLLDDIAKELVDYTSELMEGRTVNIMNTEGIIIASTEEERVGTFHQGALDAVRTGKPVAIEPDQVDRYPGAKQGYNMPLRIDGEVIGVIGVFGTPSEIKPLARLLEVFAVKYYQLEAMAIPRFAEAELRARLLKNILYPTEATVRNARMMMQEMHFNASLPGTLAVLTPAEEGADPSWAANLTKSLLEQKVITPEKALWGLENEVMVILAEGTGLPDRLLKSGLIAPEGSYRVSVGETCNEIWQVQKSFEQAYTLNVSAEQYYSDIADPENRCSFILRYTAEREKAFLTHYMEILEEEFSPEELKILLHSAQTYYEESHSVAKASEKLFIHKNTLQYRMKRLESVLEISNWPDFRKEYLIRLLIENFKSKQGLRTLQ